MFMEIEIFKSIELKQIRQGARAFVGDLLNNFFLKKLRLAGVLTY